MGGEQLQKQKLPCARGVSIRQWKGGSGIRIIFRYRGVMCRETLKLKPQASNIKYAERLRGEILNAIALGTFNYADYFPESKRSRIFGHNSVKATVGELLENYLSIAEKTLEYSTVSGYKKSCHAHLFPVFGDIPIQELSPSILRNWITSLKVTAKTVRNALIPLRNTLDQALNDGIIERNPLDKLVLSKLLNKKTMHSSFEADPFDKEEIAEFLKAATGQTRNLFQFAFFTGLRTSELIALEWQDIDWAAGIARVSRAVVLKKEKGTKTKAGKREVLLLPPALEALEIQKKYTFSKDKRVFHNPGNGKAWQTDIQMRRVWQRLLRLSGVRYRNLYQTRHTYASQMLSAGENPLWVAKQMGHKNTEMVIKHYGKWIPDKSTVAGYKPLNDWHFSIDSQ